MRIVSAQFIKGVVDKRDEILFDGVPQIAFVGRSNVGKSSLINSLLGNKSMSKVGKTAGKTTEINFFLINNGFYFVDLPGYGYAQKGFDQRDAIRQMIIDYVTSTKFHPHAVALILDCKAGLTDFDLDMLDILRENNVYTVIILNKVDKLNQKDLAAQISKLQRELGGIDIVQYSSVTEKGKDALLEKLIRG